MPKLRSIGSCERGASIIELALAAPFLATMLVGMIDLSRAYSQKLLLEQVAQRTIEKVEQQRSVSTDYSTLSTEASNAATAAGISSPTVAVDYWLECNGTRQGDGTAGNGFTNQCPNSTDVYSRYVSVTVTSTYTPLFSMRWAGSAANGSFTLTGRSGVRVQ
jgi:Flp pilus assembly protein TadG